jgi:DNA internalization-related competence protein ComEC/Rec2
MSKLRFFLPFFLFLLILFSGCIEEASSPSGQSPVPSGKSSYLKVHFIDVGQGDSILVQSPNNKNMLIDAGDNDSGNTVVSYLKEQGVEKIDILIGTHPDSDHIGGMDRVIDSFDMGTVYMPKISKSTKTFSDVMKELKRKKLKIDKPVAGEDIDFDPAMEVKILAPNSVQYDDTNNYSIVLKVSYGKTSFLLTGDAEDISEEEMLKKGYDLKANVLKVGHHASKSSTTPEFLRAVSPKYAVISVGKGNKYGHPHKKTMKKFKDGNIEVYRTDKDGTLIFESDGNKVSL